MISEPRTTGWRARIGLVVPANNTVIEPELHEHHRPGTSFHVARVIGAKGGAASVASLRRIVDGVAPALEALAIAGVDGVVYACLSTSLANPGWEERFSELARDAVGVPAMTAYAATLSAMRSCGTRRWLIVSPFGSDVQSLVHAAFVRDGIDVAATRSLDVPGLQDVCRVPPQRVYRFVRAAVEASGADVDAVAVLATDLQTFSVIEALRGDLQRDIVTTNLAIVQAVDRITIREGGGT